MNLPFFTLYGLIGCPHCAEAEAFLRVRNIPTTLVIANGDPVINEGIKKVTEQENYPVLLCRASNEIVKGFSKDSYERVVNLYYTFSGSGVPSVFGGEQQFIPQSATQVSPPQPT